MNLTSSRGVSHGTSLKIDWQRVVLNIRSAGISCAQQDKRIGRRGGFTSRIANGTVKSVWFEEGVALLDLHHDICPDKHYLAALSFESAAQIVDKRPFRGSAQSAIHSESA